MNVNLISNYSCVSTIYKEKSNSKVYQTDSEDSISFKSKLMEQEKPDLPSFIGKVYTREELLQTVDNEIQKNESKKVSLIDMIKNSCIEGSKAKFRFAGESKIYTFEEYIKELEKRSK